MAHFARIDKNNIVQEVRLIDTKDTVDRQGIEHETIGQEFLKKQTGLDGWVKTSFNTKLNKHVFGKEPFRKNFAVVGGTYDKVRDAFIAPKQDRFPSWVLNEETCDWEPPVPKPEVENPNMLAWDEENVKWIIKVPNGISKYDGSTIYVIPKK